MTRTTENTQAGEQLEPSPAVLIYDGDCGLCGASVRWVKRNSQEGAFEFVACQSPQRRQRFPHITEETCMQAMVLVLPDGRQFTGSDAAPHILRRTRRLRWLACLFTVPGVSLVARPVYRWIARRRGAISCTLHRGPS